MTKSFFVLAQIGDRIEFVKLEREESPQEGESIDERNAWFIVKLFEQHEEKIVKGLLATFDFATVFGLFKVNARQ